jgi:hypothetical protein
MKGRHSWLDNGLEDLLSHLSELVARKLRQVDKGGRAPLVDYLICANFLPQTFWKCGQLTHVVARGDPAVESMKLCAIAVTVKASETMERGGSESWPSKYSALLSPNSHMGPVPESLPSDSLRLPHSCGKRHARFTPRKDRRFRKQASHLKGLQFVLCRSSVHRTVTNFCRNVAATQSQSALTERKTPEPVTTCEIKLSCVVKRKRKRSQTPRSAQINRRPRDRLTPQILDAALPKWGIVDSPAETWQHKPP